MRPTILTIEQAQREIDDVVRGLREDEHIVVEQAVSPTPPTSFTFKIGWLER